jgi:hypothetical protein
MQNRKNIRHFGVLAGLVGLALPSAGADEVNTCLTELQGSAFAKVLRFDGDVIHIDQKAPRFVKARQIDTQKYLVGYRSADKPGAAIFTGSLVLTAKGKLSSFIVENPKGDIVRQCPAIDPASEVKPKPSPSPIAPIVQPSPTPIPKPSPMPTSEPVEKPVEKTVGEKIERPVERPVAKAPPQAPFPPSASPPFHGEIDTAD